MSHEDIEVVKEALKNHAKKPIATRVIIKFLCIILTYISKRKAVPWTQLAHLRMQIFSRKNLRKLYIYPYLTNFSTFYCRFIEDIFFLWNGTESELIKFIDNLKIKISYNRV